MRDIKESNIILRGIDRTKYLKIISLSSFSVYVQLMNVTLS